MMINLLFRSQYTSESNFNSISSCGEILEANVGFMECFDFTCVPVIFLKCHEDKLQMDIIGLNEVQRRCLDFTCDLVIFLKCHEDKLVV